MGIKLVSGGSDEPTKGSATACTQISPTPLEDPGDGDYKKGPLDELEPVVVNRMTDLWFKVTDKVARISHIRRLLRSGYEHIRIQFQEFNATTVPAPPPPPTPPPNTTTNETAAPGGHIADIAYNGR